MNFPTRKLLFTALAALILFSVAARAASEQRWLLVFNTSSAMKPRLSAVEAEVKTLLLTEFSNGLHVGDSLGVWTFNDKLHTGQFPLLTWNPEDAPEAVSNLVSFVRHQNYSGVTSFEALQPLLGRIIADSERLTVVIICDGDGEIHWTPYDTGLNDTIKQTRDARKKLRLPYVLVLRTQQGKFTGATVNFPPVPANLPPFPLLPREIKTATPAPPTNVVAVKPPPPVAPLIIVGTHVSTDTNDVPKPTTNQVVVTVAKTNSPPPNPVHAPSVAQLTNPPPVLTNLPAITAETNATFTDRSATDKASRYLAYVVAGIIALALLAIILAVRARRTPPSSLITSSLEQDSRPPSQK